MDMHGIGAAMAGMLGTYQSAARRSGRTTRMINSLKNGDRVVFMTEREAKRVTRLCADRGISVDAIVGDPARPYTIMGSGRSSGKTVFDHSFIEQFYLEAIKSAQKHIDGMELALSCNEPPVPTNEVRYLNDRESAWGPLKFEPVGFDAGLDSGSSIERSDQYNTL